MKRIILLAIVVLIPTAAVATDKYAEFETHTFSGGKAKLPYRLLKPKEVEKGKKYPLVLALHGFGDRGTDNEKPLTEFGSFFLNAGNRQKFPCFVLVPQASGSWIENAVFDKPIPLSAKPTQVLSMTAELVQATVKKEPVDADRIYLMGYSNGACAVWDLLERLPQAWAAAVPMAGAGDPSRVAAAKRVPIWAFHGTKDPTIPIARMLELQAALRSAGAHPMYTTIKDGVHYDARKAMHDPSLLPWMFAQRRGKPEVPFEQAAGPSAKLPTSLEKK